VRVGVGVWVPVRVGVMVWVRVLKGVFVMVGVGVGVLVGPVGVSVGVLVGVAVNVLVGMAGQPRPNAIATNVRSVTSTSSSPLQSHAGQLLSG